jgi:hypothetical protein
MRTLLGTILLLVLAGMIVSSLSTRTTPNSAAKPKDDGPTEWIISVPGGGPNVLAGASEAANDRLVTLSVAHENLGISQMVLAGQAYLIPQGTRVLPLQRGFLASEVRVQEGPSRGAAVWLPSEFVKQVPVVVPATPRAPAEAPKNAEPPFGNPDKKESPAAKQAERQAPRKAEERPGKVFDMKAEQDAANNLAYVKRLLKRGEAEKAHHRLEEILRDWPTTEAAKEAQTLLTKLLKEESAR